VLALLLLLQPSLEHLRNIELLSETTLPALTSDLLFIATVLAAALLAEALVRATLDWYLEDIAHRTQTTLDEEFLPLLQKLNIVVVFALAAIIVLDHFSINVSGLLATAGIASLAVAMAAQETLANMFAGVSLLVDKPFREGDRIELTDGTFGDVRDVGLRSTKILTRENTVVVIPNKELASAHITNQVYPDYRLRLVVQVGVSYGTELRRVKRIILEILNELDMIVSEPEPKVHFVEFGSSALMLRICFWIENYRDRFATLDTVHMALKDHFEKEGIEIPYPQHVVHFPGEPESPEGLKKDSS
jgi:MscS family membrane protein